MRIALLAHAPIPGGSTDLLFQARDAFLQRGHEVQCIFGYAATPADPRSAGAWIIPPVPGPWQNLLRAYREKVESFRPDVVYTIAGRVEADLLRFLSCPRVRHVSSLEEHEYFNVPRMLRIIRPYVEACTANTPDAQEKVAQITGQPTYLLPYLFPEPLNQIADVDGARLLDEKNPVEVAFVSRFERFQKRSHWLPEIIRACEKAGTNLAWHFYGSGPDLADVQARVGADPRVTFHGWVSREMIYERLPHHDILFYCSRWEGLPISMVEGMRCGLACVSTDIPAGIRWTLEQGGGWLYDASTPGDAARALLNAVQDRALILKKRREALQLARKIFNVTAAGQDYDLLEKAFAQLRYNGQTLDLDRASRFHGVSLATFLKRHVIKPDE